jgi:hypothetical protein
VSFILSGELGHFDARMHSAAVRKKVMRISAYLAGVALVALAASAQDKPQPPFQIEGLHPDLVFTDAVTAIERLGGVCRIKQSRSQGGGVSAQCVIETVGENDGGATAGEAQSPKNGPMIGPQRITRVGVEAALDSAQLTRIVFMFDGGLEAVAQYLVQQYGQPDHDGTTSDKQSWSHSKRRGWKEGNYTMGLLNSPDLVILTVNRQSADPGPG